MKVLPTQDVAAAGIAAATTTSAAESAAEVRCHGVRKRFASGTVALDGVDVDCPAGQVLVLLGPSGCGKTTLLRSVAGLEQPDVGRIEIGGRDVTNVDPQFRGVAMVFQNYALYPDKTAAENITFPLRMAKVPKDEQRRRLETVAELLQLGALLERKPAQLSGGQKQRVGIGRALARGPRVLLMDEPLSNLDAQLRIDMRAELLALQRRLGTTILYVTHEQTEALTLADRLVVLRDGRIEQRGAPQDVYDRPASTFVARFLGAMNLLRGVVDGGAFQIAGGGALTLPTDAGTDAAPAARGPFVLGVRPEAIALGEPQPDELSARGAVRLVERLGADQLLHVELPGGAGVRVRVPAGSGFDATLTLRIPAHAIHIFEDDGTRTPGDGQGEAR